MWEALFKSMHDTNRIFASSEVNDGRIGAVNRCEEDVTTAERLLHDIHIIEDDEEYVFGCDILCEDVEVNIQGVKEDLDDKVEKASTLLSAVDNVRALDN